LANPFFDWTASLSRFIDFDVPTAADLNAPLDQVTTGFDAVDTRIDAIDVNLAGLSSPVQTQLDAKADITGETYTGAHDFTGATVTAPTQAAGDASEKVATTEFVDRIAFTTATGLTAASQAEMEAGTEAGLRAMSPLRVAQAIAALTEMVYEARATNAAFAAADKDKFIEYTGSFTQTFGSAASLGNGWKVVLKNAFTDSVYLTPSGGATIDGVADFLMYPGEARLLQCDGTNFHSIILQGFKMLPTTSGFFFEPPGYIGWDVFIQPPGGGGGSGRRGDSTGNNAGGAGGSGGAWAQAFIRATTPGTSHTITIGAPGPGGAAVTADDTNGNAGTAGGNSSFGALLVTTGGAAGNGGVVSSTPVPSSAATASAGFVTAAGTAGGGVTSNTPVAGTAATGWGATGGGGGCGLAPGPTAGDGAAGGASGTSSSGSQIAGGTGGATAGTRTGGAGNAPTTTKRRGGTGGGGGASHATLAGGTGGAGAHGGGGGGGGSSDNGANSGAGGAGGAGYFEIVGVF
jgi:hypothetical protein